MTNRVLRLRQIWAWAVMSLFVAGFFYAPVGAWTGPILGVWFVGTQKPRTGFLWMLAFAFVPSVLMHSRALAGGGRGGALWTLLWLALGAVLATLPFLIYRLVSQRTTTFVASLVFPACSVAIPWAVTTAMVQAGSAVSAPGLVPGVAHFTHPTEMVVGFARAWLASALVWAWEREFRSRRGGKTVRLPAWSERSDTIALLRSPSTGEPVQFADDGLVTPSGEQFPIHDGIPAFLRPQDLTGANLKYNRLYETIGGFYDDTQRVASALAAMDRDGYVMSYMGLIEVKAGDAVLETSVGTGLNFKYLSREIRRFGLDLSGAMLAACQQNLRRWEMDAELFLGNAEALPFADESFDVVFHVGGINFFSDRGAAIREMVRVARPGSQLLIADETEEHVKAAYENIPYTREFFKGREDTVAAPVDLLPPEMEEVRLKIIEFSGKKRFYALTFRKPAKSMVPNGSTEPASTSVAGC